jgi:hypothetical protein
MKIADDVFLFFVNLMLWVVFGEDK